jgi:hypothetical protein
MKNKGLFFFFSFTYLFQIYNDIFILLKIIKVIFTRLEEALTLFWYLQLAISNAILLT